jgi:putative transposase
MKAHKYRIYPNEEQKQIFAVHFGHVRHVYNWGLAIKQEAYKTQQIKITKREVQDMLVASKKQDKIWLNDVNSQSLLASLDNLDKAYTRFFKKQNAFPRFKSKYAKQAFACPQHVRVDSQKQLLTLPKIKNIRIKLHRELPPNFKTVTISKTPSHKYYASFIIEEQAFAAVSDSKIAVNIQDIIGLDLGINHLAIASNGKKYNNLRLLDKSLHKLAKWQKINARQLVSKEKLEYVDIKNNESKTKIIKKYSKNKEKSKLKIAIMHEKIANQRNDYLHKVSHNIVSKSHATYIAMENLHVKGMIKNKKLARHIANAAWYKFKSMLEYKAERQHKKVISIDRWLPSSKTCSCCGHKLEKLSLNIRSWQCPICNTINDRDINASINIAKFAQVKLADGLGHSLVVKSPSTSKLISVSEVAKDVYINSVHRSQEAPPIVVVKHCFVKT